MSTADTKTTAILYEIRGEKLLEEENFEEAEQIFYESFKSY